MASPTVRSSTAPVSGGSATSAANTIIGDLVIAYVWERAGAGIPTHTLDSGNGFVEIRSHSHNDGSTDGRLSVAYKIATANGANAYAPYSSSTGSPVWWTGCVVVTKDTYDVTTRTPATDANSVTATGTGAPDPPVCPSAGTFPAQDYLAFAISAWHLGSALTLTPGVPASPGTWTSRGDVSGTANGDVCCVTSPLTAATSINPGAFTDNQTPNGTCSITFVIAPFDATRRAQVSWAELEVPNATRRAQVSWAEFETPTFGDLVQDVAAFSADSDPETYVFANPVVANNLLYIAFTSNPDAVVTSVTDTLGHTYLLSDNYNIAGVGRVWVYVATATSSGANTISVAIAGADPVGLGYAAEFQGPFAADPRDQVAHDNAVGTTANTSEITPSSDGTLLVGLHIGGADLTGAGSGWEVIDDTNTGAGWVLVNRKVQGTATAEASTATLSSAQWISLIGNFTPPVATRRAQVAWAELEVPNAPRRAQVSWAELEVPNGQRRAYVSYAEMEVPNAPRRAQVAWAELEVPNGPRRAYVSWAEMEVPELVTEQRAQVSWAEMEVPNAPRRAYVAWAEMEVPTAPRRAYVSYAEMEVPIAPRRAYVSWAELEVPSVDPSRRAYISWAEFETPGQFADDPFMNTLNLNLIHRSTPMQSWNRVSQGRASAAGTDETTAIEIINTSTTESAIIKRITAGLVAATATSLGVGRPAAKGVTPTSPVALLLEDGTGSGDLKTAIAWGTPPTKPTTFYRMGSAPATIGSLITFTFESGIRLAPGETLVVWFDTTSSLCNITVEAEEPTISISNP